MIREKKFQTHRGFCSEGVMENTLASLAEAHKRGSQMVEFDVRLTKDFVPVLYHDPTLKRLHKVPLAVSSLNLQQMKTFAPEVTTLEDVLQSKNIPQDLNIELKTDSAVNPALEIQVTRLVKKYKAEERVVFSSFNPFSLIRAKTFAPDIARALLVTQEDEEKNYWFLKAMSLLPLCDAQFLHWHQDMTSRERIQKFMEYGYQIAVFTVNDPARAKEFFSWGVGSIISDQLLSIS
jgi:glycerophosphoryl diester phosphodiesterase